MKTNFFLVIFLVIFLAFDMVSALNFSPGFVQYVKDMEFYYQQPRPEIIEPMLKNFEKSGILAQGDKRLMVAAFLAQLAGSGQISMRKLAAKTKDSGKNVRRTLAWSGHLAKIPDEKAFLKQLLDDSDAVLLKQIEASPAPLEEWSPELEESVLNMFLAAFMATGQTHWLDSIINTALLPAERDNDQIALRAAALLHDYAPRHSQIASRLNEISKTLPDWQREILKLVQEQGS